MAKTKPEKKTPSEKKHLLDKKPRQTISSKLGLNLSVARIRNNMRQSYVRENTRFTEDASVYLAAVLQHISESLIQQTAQRLAGTAREVILDSDLMETSKSPEFEILFQQQ